MENEVWKDIPAYEGLYQVSNFGKVKTLTKEIKSPRNTRRIIMEKILKPNLRKDNYYIVCLNKEGKSKSFYIHKLVAVCFLNHVPNKHDEVVDHIDNNTKNNDLKNLQIITQRINMTKDRTGEINFTGVFKSDSTINPYMSKIMKGKKSFYLGVFKTKEEAHLMYQKALKHINEVNSKEELLLKIRHES